MSSAKKRKENVKSVRLYHEEWFTEYGIIERDKKTICILCNETITTRSYNVKRHFEAIHKYIVLMTREEKQEFFFQKLKEYKAQTTTFKQFIIPKNYLTAANFHLAYSIAKHGKVLSEGEFLKEAFLECSSSLFADFKEKDLIIKRIKELPISRNTIKDRILALNDDTSSQLICDLKNIDVYSVCFDESTDITGQAQLAVIAKYKSGDIIREELVKLITLSGKTTGAAIKKELTEQFSKMNIDIKKIVSITTDGAPSMVGKNIGVIKQLKDDIGHSFLEFHCIIHQQVLCAKKGLKSFSNVMAVVTSIVNFISARSLNKREFSQLLDEVESQYSGVPMYNNVRWLSRGQVLNRFVSLLDEIRLFLNEKDKNYSELTNIEWLYDLMFFTDITQHFNELNKKLQGRGQLALTMYENIKSFLVKLDIFSNDLNTKTMKYFPFLRLHYQNSTIFENSNATTENIIKQYVLIIQEIKEAITERFNQFKQVENTLQFTIFPHKVEFKNLDLKHFDWLDIADLEMELVEFQNSFIWKKKFEDLQGILEKNVFESIATGKRPVEEHFENIVLKEWNSMPETFKSMKKFAEALLTIFGSTYTCEQLFSSMNFIKSTNRNRLGTDTMAACLRLKATNYDPKIEKLAGSKQQQTSH